MKPAQTATAVSLNEHVVGTTADYDYQRFLLRLQNRFMQNVGNGMPLFSTDATGLFDAYLGQFASDDRQHHNCNACRHFIERFGGLVTIDASGTAHPAFWSTEDATPLYARSIQAVIDRVIKAKVTGVFLSSEPVWGTPVTGPWQHLSVAPLIAMVHRHPLHTAGQAMAEKREDYKNVVRALADYTPELVQSALVVLNSETLYRSDKVLGQAQFLADLHARRAAAKSVSKKHNLTWLAIATAPAGFCHPRSSMIGTLLDDIAAGLDHATYARRFANKMNPLQYQRPQSPPAAGNIDQAEKIVEKLGIAAALKRRFARLDEVLTFWRPTPAAPAASNGSVFGHLAAKNAPSAHPVALPKTAITWDKFKRTVLPGAHAIELVVPAVGAFAALVTADDPDAPPILQWDSPELRNPFSWYQYVGGTPAESWGLVPNTFVPVTALVDQPSNWYGEAAHHGDSVFFILDGCRDTNEPHLCLFPDTLKSDLHAVRATLEAFSKAGRISGVDQASACGYKLEKGAPSNITVRVTDAKANTALFHIDRWD